MMSNKRFWTYGLAAGWLLSGAARSVFAAGEAHPIDTGDTAWILTSSALVLMMTIPGLALFYGGLVRSKNILSTLMPACSVPPSSESWVLFGTRCRSRARTLVGNLSLFAGLPREQKHSGHDAQPRPHIPRCFS